MKVYLYEGKNAEEILDKAVNELKLDKEDVLFKTKEEEGGLFKGKKVKVELLIKDEIMTYVKEMVKDITNKMGIEVNFECQKRDNYIRINLFSDKNNILIGKNGKTIEALQTILKYSIFNKTSFHVNVLVDVENYKEKHQKTIEIVAKRVAREVERTGVEAALDNMNSFERRLVHEVLSKIDGIYTESVGEEPNRHIVIKPSKE